MMDVLFDYIRLVCYGLVISSGIASLSRKRFSRAILIADILFAGALISTRLMSGFKFYGLNGMDYILTPAVIFWAALHYYNLLKQ